MGPRVMGLVGSGSGGVEELLSRLIRPAQDAGWTVAVTLTSTAGQWLRKSRELPWSALLDALNAAVPIAR